MVGGNRDWVGAGSGRSWGVGFWLASPWTVTAAAQTDDGLRLVDREEEQAYALNRETGREAGRPRGAQGDRSRAETAARRWLNHESGQEFGELRRGSGSLKIMRTARGLPAA